MFTAIITFIGTLMGQLLMISPQHLIDYLQNQSAIAGEVGTLTIGGHSGVPVFPEMTPTLAGQMPRRAIVVSAAGGPSILGRNNPLEQNIFDVRCYGSSMADAWPLADAVHSHFITLGRVTMNGQAVTAIYPVSDGIQGREPDGDFPYVLVSYRMIVSG